MMPAVSPLLLLTLAEITAGLFCAIHIRRMLLQMSPEDSTYVDQADRPLFLIHGLNAAICAGIMLVMLGLYLAARQLGYT